MQEHRENGGQDKGNSEEQGGFVRGQASGFPEEQGKRGSGQKRRGTEGLGKGSGRREPRGTWITVDGDQDMGNSGEQKGWVRGQDREYPEKQRKRGMMTGGTQRNSREVGLGSRTGGSQRNRENGGQDTGNSEEQSGWVRGQEGENPEEQGLDGD